MDGCLPNVSWKIFVSIVIIIASESGAWLFKVEIDQVIASAFKAYDPPDSLEPRT